MTTMPVEPEVVPPELQKITHMSEALTAVFVENSRAATIAAEVNALVVNDDASYAKAAELMNDVVKREQGRIAQSFNPLCTVFDKLHKGFTGMRAKFLAPWNSAETEIKRKMAQYIAAQKAARERERLALEAAERKRLEDERVADAIAVQDAGDVQQASAMLEAPIAQPPIFTPPPAPKVAGVSSSEKWTVDEEVPVDLVKLVMFCATPEGKAFIPMFLQPNMSGLKNAAKDMKSNFPDCGVKVGPAVGIRGKRSM